MKHILLSCIIALESFAVCLPGYAQRHHRHHKRTHHSSVRAKSHITSRDKTSNFFVVTDDPKTDSEMVQLAKSAEDGDMVAQYQMGLFYATGINGFTKNTRTAFRWFHKSAQQKYSQAQYSVGLCYEKGLGVRRDMVRALTWYLNAAEQGNALAQYKLGVFYAEGKSVIKDEVQAAEWLQKAAKQGNADAQAELDKLNIK